MNFFSQAQIVPSYFIPKFVKTECHLHGQKNRLIEVWGWHPPPPSPKAIGGLTIQIWSPPHVSVKGNWYFATIISLNFNGGEVDILGSHSNFQQLGAA